MAVQPDKRPKDVQDEAVGTNVTERYRNGRYWLGELAMITHPVSYAIRRDGSALWQGDVWRDPHLGWMTADEATGREYRGAGPAECLAWWVARRAELKVLRHPFSPGSSLPPLGGNQSVSA